MNFNDKLKNYAKLVIRAGVNLQKGQELLLRSPIQCAEFARLLAEEAYRAGASRVTTDWSDERMTRMKYDYCPVSEFETVPEWLAALNNNTAKNGGAILTIAASDPEAMAGVDPSKMGAWVKASHKACRAFYDGMDLGRNVWCIISAPTSAWAKKVFPDVSEKEAVEKLWDAIFKAVRADWEDPVEAWTEHKKAFAEKLQFLNESQFDELHYTNDAGTDITVGLPENHAWAGGGGATVDGVDFFPNMPTEEVFCTPDKNRCDGTVKSALPLNYQGNLVDKFSVTFEKGKVTDFSAETGYETLRQIIETDEGSHHLGEIALVPKKSPISEMGILFYNTLYDENASCHFALGKGFAECFAGGLSTKKEELMEKGMNDSATHVDFMIGTADLKITGRKKDGTETVLFENGNWAV